MKRQSWLDLVRGVEHDTKSTAAASAKGKKETSILALVCDAALPVGSDQAVLKLRCGGVSLLFCSCRDGTTICHTIHSKTVCR